jgi:hypothetical protein
MTPDIADPVHEPSALSVNELARRRTFARGADARRRRRLSGTRDAAMVTGMHETITQETVRPYPMRLGHDRTVDGSGLATSS